MPRILNMENKKILLGHGSGRLNLELVKTFLEEFANPILNKQDDGAVFQINSQKLVLTTDSFVVNPIFFPGGDIGKLAVAGTVNDLSMMGAEPIFLALAFILEEGFSEADLKKIIFSIKAEARKAGVKIVTGDTKVVERDRGHKIYITSTGLGRVLKSVQLSGQNIRPGDRIILSGPLGDHEMAILTSRENFKFKTKIKSDVASLNFLVKKMLTHFPEIRCLRDPTRGGVATILNEIALQSRVKIFLEEEKIPVRPAVKAACDLFGLDPLYLANEGKLVAFTPAGKAEKLLKLMKTFPLAAGARIIGVVKKGGPEVILNTASGGQRILALLTGQLPRIC